MSELAIVGISQLDPSTLGMTWSDGSSTSIAVRPLRLACRCAHCVDEWTREKILDDSKVPVDVKPKRIDPVGRYALRIAWSDGHDTGIFTFEHLRKLSTQPQASSLSH